MISFILPAYNEELVLGRTLATLTTAATAVGEPYEILVVDDASDDRTATIAEEHQARVVAVHLRQIAAVRNAGVREAKGEILVFLDADTILPEATLRAALGALSDGAIGGGARVFFDDSLSLGHRALVAGILVPMRLLRWAAGCFIFCRRAAFEAVGGFDERYYASEEIHLSRALKSQGRFLILREGVVTSARKLRLIKARHFARVFTRFAVRGPGMLKKREALEDVWYDGKLRDTGPAE